MNTVTFDRIVVYKSENGRDGWQPVKQELVPEWVKQPEVMSRLIQGEECMDCAEGTAGSAWYRAARVSDLEMFISPTH